MLEKRQMPKTKKPRCGDTRASGNEINFEEEIVMSDNSTNVIPFNFGKQQVRTLLVGSDPWFSVQDILRSLDYTDSYKPARAAAHVPDQWKRVHRLHTLGGTQQALMLSEQGLYFFIGRSDKPKALPFQMWLAGEVLPAIRKHGRYEDKHSKMATLMDELIGMSELSVIKGLIRDKGKAVQADKRQSFTLTMHSRLNTRFNVPRTELIPAHQFESACNFIAAYALEGEYLGKEEAKAKQPLSIHYPVEVLARHKPEMVKSRGDGHAWLDVSLHDLRAIRGDNTPCEAILIELRRAGYEVDGAWWELRTYRNKMQEIASFARGLACVIDEPHRYAIKVGDAA